MVFYSKAARQDLKSIFDGLVTWSKHKLEHNHIVTYHNCILDICEGLDAKAFHFNTQYPIHKRFGEKVHTYRRSKQTNLYIIYNLDQHGNVYIQSILSNHNTVADAK